MSSSSHGSVGNQRQHRLSQQSSEDDVGDVAGGILLDLQSRVDETKAHVFRLPSNDPFLPDLHQIGDSIHDITSHLLCKDGVTIYPRKMSSSSSPVVERVCVRVTERYGSELQTLAYLADAMSVTLNMQTAVKVTDEVICDVIIVPRQRPAVILTVASACHSCDTSQYNLSIAKGLVSEVRNFTEDHFSALYGVIHESDLETSQSFEDALERIKLTSSAFCIPDSLAMTDDKFHSIVRALVSSLSVSAAIPLVSACAAHQTDEDRFEEQEEELWFLTKDQFLLLAENIDTRGRVVVWAGPHSGSTTLMVEIARRLERSGRTMLVSGSELVCKFARDTRLCSRVIGRDEFLKLSGDVGDLLKQVDHVVAEDVPEMLLHQDDRRKRVWLCMKVKGSLSPGDGQAVMKPPVYTSLPQHSATPIQSFRDTTPVLKTVVTFDSPADTSDPRIYDFTVVMVGGTSVIVVIDQNNNCVKSRHTANGDTVTGYLSIDRDAAGITNIANRVAVTVPLSRVIRIISVSPDLQPYHVIHTERRYYAIAGVGADKMAVCAPKCGRPCVDIIDYTGCILNSLTTTADGGHLFQFPLTVHTLPPHDLLVYDRGARSLLAVSERGHVVFRYNPEKKLEDPCGVAVNPGGDVLVSDSRQQRVVLLGGDGRVVKDVLGRRDNLVFPYRLCCDSAGLLYVASHYKEIHVFQFS